MKTVLTIVESNIESTVFFPIFLLAFLFIILFLKKYFLNPRKFFCLHEEKDLKYLCHQKEGSRRVCYNECIKCGLLIHD